MEAGMIKQYNLRCPRCSHLNRIAAVSVPVPNTDKDYICKNCGLGFTQKEFADLLSDPALSSERPLHEAYDPETGELRTVKMDIYKK